MSEETIKNNHEIFFVYDAKDCNPNGDPDDENKPRMDSDRGINLVSDLRLKRYIRDYLQKKGEGIFVSKVEGKSLTQSGMLEYLFNKENRELKKQKKKIKLSKDDVTWLKTKLIDVRLFGAIIPDTEFEGSGNAIFTGPVQFNWGYSLNKVNVRPHGITSHFTSGEEKGQGAMGKDYRVDYSLIAFHGVVSAWRAEETSLKENDIKLLDNAMLNSIPQMATTRSKVGQTPRLYIRVEYNSPESFIGDFRQYIDQPIEPLDRKANPTIKEFPLDLSRLNQVLAERKGDIQAIRFWSHKDLKISGWDLKTTPFD